MKNSEINALSRDYWSGRAEEFSRLRMDEYGTPARRHMLKFIKSCLPERGTEPLHALDAGCGAGFLTLLLLELGCRVTAVDFSSEMLVEAAKNCGQYGYDYKAQFLRMDVQKLDFPDESFDFVVTRNVLWILPDAEKAYKELFRVLKFGGVLLNMDANYGKAFREAEERGETPRHPTQTVEQLKTRNSISRNLKVTNAERPAWDMRLLWREGASEVRCLRDLEKRLCIEKYNQAAQHVPPESRGSMFAIIAKK